jgi:hypothetical protein
MAETEIINELFKYGGLVGVLAYGLWVFWKRYDKFTATAQAELAATRQEVKDLMNNDRKVMQDALDRNTRAMESHIVEMRKSTDIMTRFMSVMNCIITEIKEFKKSEVFQEHEKRKSNITNQ